MREEDKIKNPHLSPNIEAERMAQMRLRNKQGVSVRQIAEEFNTSKSSVHRAVRRQERNVIAELESKVFSK